jgi:hypothetical protein
MPFLDDFVGAVGSYPGDYVELEIVEVAVPNGALNENESGTFRVRVTNNGPLNMEDVTVRVKGLNGVTVANNGAAAPYVDEFVTQPLATIYGHGPSVVTSGGVLKFMAPANAQASADILKATLEGWNGDMAHILLGHSDPRPNGPKGTYAAEVFPA